MRTAPAILCLALVSSPALAEGATHSGSVSVGPWEIATTYNGKKFDNCMMTRTSGDIDISLIRTRDGLSLLLHSEKWKLDRGKVYAVRLTAGSRSMGAEALAETKSVTITLTDSTFNRHLRTANVLQVHGAGATITVSLNESTAALTRLDLCFDRNGQGSAETNPFVAVAGKP
jgi:hypothetical protein